MGAEREAAILLDALHGAIAERDNAQAELNRVRTLVRDYWAAMADEDFDAEGAFRQRLFDWAGI